MRRVVLDTNILVGSAYNADSASRRIVEACRDGRLTLLVSPGIEREYRHTLRQAVRRPDELEDLRELIEQAERIEPKQTPRVVPDDPDDDKFLAAAVAGRAEAIISNDDHLLQLGRYEDIPILRPSEFER